MPRTLTSSAEARIRNQEEKEEAASISEASGQTEGPGACPQYPRDTCFPEQKVQAARQLSTGPAGRAAAQWGQTLPLTPLCG